MNGSENSEGFVGVVEIVDGGEVTARLNFLECCRCLGEVVRLGGYKDVQSFDICKHPQPDWRN